MFIDDFKCSLTELECDRLKSRREQSLGGDIMPLEDVDFFSLPTALRVLKGLVQHVNTFIQRYSVFSVVDFNHSDENMYVVLNCEPDRARAVVEKVIPNNKVELSGM